MFALTRCGPPHQASAAVSAPAPMHAHVHPRTLPCLLRKHAHTRIACREATRTGTRVDAHAHMTRTHRYPQTARARVIRLARVRRLGLCASLVSLAAAPRGGLLGLQQCCPNSVAICTSSCAPSQPLSGWAVANVTTQQVVQTATVLAGAGYGFYRGYAHATRHVAYDTARRVQHTTCGRRSAASYRGAGLHTAPVCQPTQRHTRAWVAALSWLQGCRALALFPRTIFHSILRCNPLAVVIAPLGDPVERVATGCT
jgi:hypothetical protein